MPGYDDQRFLDLIEALNEIIWELLDMDFRAPGYMQKIVQEQVDMAFESFGAAE